MDPIVQAIWWMTLAIALVLTVIAAALVLRVVYRCGEILELARRTVPAAQGIARNTSAIANLGAVIRLAPTLLTVCGQIDGSAKTIAATLDSVAPSDFKRGDLVVPPNPPV